MAISGLAINGEAGINQVHPALNISIRATLGLPYERRDDSMLDQLAPAERGVSGGGGLVGTKQLCALLVCGGIAHKYGAVANNDAAQKVLSAGLLFGGAVLTWRLICPK